MNTSGKPDRDGPPPLSKVVQVEKIPEAGLSGRIMTTKDQNSAIVAALDLVFLKALDFTYELKPLGKNRVLLTGRLEAECEQRCVVTLDLVPCHVSEPVKVEFWPPEDLARLENQAAQDVSELDPEGPEPYESGRIDIGHLAYEIFATSLDPYPRKEGIFFTWEDEFQDEEEAGDNPFSVLGSLRKNKK